MFLGLSIRNKSTAGHYRPKRSALLTDLGETIEFGGPATHGIHGLISVIV